MPDTAPDTAPDAATEDATEARFAALQDQIDDLSRAVETLLARVEELQAARDARPSAGA